MDKIAGKVDAAKARGVGKDKAAHRQHRVQVAGSQLANLRADMVRAVARRPCYIVPVGAVDNVGWALPNMSGKARPTSAYLSS